LIASRPFCFAISSFLAASVRSLTLCTTTKIATAIPEHGKTGDDEHPRRALLGDLGAAQLHLLLQALCSSAACPRWRSVASADSTRMRARARLRAAPSSIERW